MENWIFIVNIKIMKKIRLTESELTNIIKRVISEQNKDVVIPKVISDKQKEFSNMAKQIIQKHKEFCEYIISNKRLRILSFEFRSI